MVKVTNKNRARFFFFGITSFAILSAIIVFIGSYWIQILDKYKEKKNLDEKIITLKEKEEQLKLDVEKLEDPEYIARYAREKYMYSKNGEYIIIMPED
ncbi:MAG: septum formation initiator family protein [Bacilli bacterium]|nr:septum formation initiator family protein [Bacilli bacterium]